jgi:hypothetical protein
MGVARVAEIVAEIMAARPEARALWAQTAARRELAAHLVGARCAAGLGTDELAARAGLTEEQVAAIESATAPAPSPAEIAAYLTACYSPWTISVAPLPKLDLEALVALQKANIATIVAAQKIMLDLARAMARKQVELVEEMMARSQALLGTDGTKQPSSLAGEVRAAAEKAVAAVNETVELGVKVQSEIADLFVRRAAANEDEHEREARRRPVKAG